MALIGRKSVLGLVSLVIPGSFFSTGILLSFAYSSQFLNTFGDIRQVEPEFLGIVVGSILFSLIGYLTRSSWIILSIETLVASLLFVASYIIIMVNSLVLNGTLIIVISLSMTSVFAPVVTILKFPAQKYSAPIRAIFGITHAVFSILLVYVFLYYYVTNGFLNFFMGPLILLVLSFVSFSVLVRVR
jgi:hypothetical protein